MKTNTVEHNWKKLFVAGAAVLSLAGGGAVLTHQLNADAATSDTAQTQAKSDGKEDQEDHRKGKHGHGKKDKNLEAADPGTIKIDQAAALKTFATEANNAKVSELELEFDKDKYVYEIEGFEGSKEYKVEIDAQTGDVSGKETDTMDEEDKAENKALDLSKVISRDEAGKIAQQTAGAGTSKQWELEQKGDTAVWKVLVADGTKVSRVRINAVTKEVLNEKDGKNADKTDKKAADQSTAKNSSEKSTAKTTKDTTKSSSTTGKSSASAEKTTASK